MIRVTFIGADQDSKGFTLAGHAEYADKGQDIVCSAISALAQTTIYALVERHKLTDDYELSEGQISCFVELTDLSDRDRQIVEILLLALYDGISQIQAAYGSEYVHIEGGYYDQV